MNIGYAIEILKHEIKEQEDWYERWKTTTEKGSSLPGKEEQIKGLKNAVKILKNSVA